MTDVFYLLGAMALVMAVRLWPSWRFPVIGSDAGSHLLMRREVRRHGFRAPRKLAPCLFDRQFNYPWLYHQVMAVFPEAWLRRWPALPSALIDGLHTAVVFLAGAWLSRQAGASGPAPAAGGFVCALLYGLNPALLAKGFGPRTYEITPRPFGELLFTVSLGAALLALHLRSWPWAAAAVLAGAGILLSSKFAAQVMVFFIPVVALLTGLTMLWILPVAAGLMALLLSGGRYRHVLRGQLRHLKYYRSKLQYTYTGVADRNRWSDVRRAGEALREHGLFSAALAGAARRCWANNTYIQMASRGVIFLLLAAVSVERWRTGAGVPAGRWYGWLQAWAWVWIAPFLLTSWKHARFLGEAERYAEFSLAPAALLVGLPLARGPVTPAGWALLALFAAFAFLFWVNAIRDCAKASADGRAERDELRVFLAGLPPGSVLLGIPEHLVTCPIASLLPHRYADIIADLDQFVLHLEQHCEGYPWPKPDWPFWRKAGVQYLVTWPPAVIAAHRPSLDYGFSKLDRLFANDRFQVYKLDGQEGPT